MITAQHFLSRSKFPAAILNLTNPIVKSQRVVEQTLLPHRTVCTSCLLNAGHSHWENIRHIKSAKDSARSKSFVGLLKQLETVVKEGGTNDPTKNSQLAQVLKLCKKGNVPKATIEKALSPRNVMENEFVLAVTGPGGSSLLVTCAAKSIAEARKNLLYAFRISKFDGTLVPENQEEFTRKWIIITDTGGKKINEDEATEIALIIGAEDVRVLEDEEGSLLEFMCDPVRYREAENELQATQENLTVLSSKLEYIPINTVDLSDRDSASIELFFQGLRKASLKEEIKIEVLDVSHNINNITTTFHS